MEAFSQFASDLDASTHRLLARGARLTEVLKQGQFMPYPVEEQVVALYSGVKGYLDTIPTNKVVDYEKALMTAIRGKGQDILAAIRTDKEIKPETETKLKGFLDDFGKTFQ